MNKLTGWTERCRINCKLFFTFSAISYCLGALAGDIDVGIDHEEFVSGDKIALIDELLELNGIRYINEEMANQYTQNLRRYLSRGRIEVDDDFFLIVQRETARVIFDSYVGSGEFDKIYHSLYGNAFSKEELSELVGFYRSNLGQKLVATSGQLARQGFDKSVEFTNKLLPQIQSALELSLSEAGYDLESIANKAGRGIRTPKPDRAELGRLITESCELVGDEAKKIALSDRGIKATPIFRGQPAYPYLARLLGMKGWVELNFTVNRDGSTSDIEVTNAKPVDVFNAAAIESVKDYIYCSSESVFKNQKIRIRFEMAE